MIMPTEPVKGFDELIEDEAILQTKTGMSRLMNVEESSLTN